MIFLPDNQYFADVVAGEEELDGSKVAEKRLDMAIVEDALQAKTVSHGGMQRACWTTSNFAAGLDVLHFQSVRPHDVIAVAWCVRTGLAGVKERQQHTAGFQHGP